PGKLRDLLGEVGVGEVLNSGKRQRIRRERERQDRGVRGIDFAVDGRARQITRQERRRRIDRGLHLLLGDVDRGIERELQRDERGAERARRRHLLQAGQLPELPFERRRHGRGHDVGAGPRIKGQDLYRWIVDLRQRRNGQ